MRLFTLLLASASLVLADGGVVLLHQEITPLVVTVFAAPVPPRAGMIDLSLLLQTSETLDPVLDADVQFTLTNGSSQIRAQATHARTQNKMLYAASVVLSTQGDWRYTATAQTAKDASPVSVSGIITVGPPEPKWTEYAGYLALPFVCLAVFALHQWLRWGRARH